MEDLNREKEQTERELARLREELDQRTSHLEDLRSRAALKMSGLNQENIRSEQLRGEALMHEMLSIRVFPIDFTHSLT